MLNASEQMNGYGDLDAEYAVDTYNATDADSLPGEAARRSARARHPPRAVAVNPTRSARSISGGAIQGASPKTRAAVLMSSRRQFLDVD